MTYQAARLLHTVGALGMFVALGVELEALRGLSSARTPSQARCAVDLHRLTRVIGPGSLLLAVLPGVYMASASWGWPPWLLLSIGALGLVVVLGAGVTRVQIQAIGAAVHKGERLRDVAAGSERRLALMWSSLLIRAVLLAAIVLLMTTKPGSEDALAASSAAVAAVAVVAALPFGLRRRRAGGIGAQRAVS